MDGFFFLSFSLFISVKQLLFMTKCNSRNIHLIIEAKLSSVKCGSLLPTYLLQYFWFRQPLQDFKSVSLTLLMQAVLPHLAGCCILENSW